MEAFKVCVVDDCVDEALVLCEGLRLNGYEAVAVHTGAEALQRCAQGDIELILLDVGLPDLDGYEVCRRLKARPETADIPVVFVTARGSSTDVDHGYSLGAVNYIVKPYNLPFVMVLVDSALRTRSATGPLPTPLEDPVYTDGLTGLKNRRFLYERLHEETDKARRYGYPVSCILVEFEEPPDAEEAERALSLEDMMVEVAMTLMGSSRTCDIIARYEGYVFAMILPHTGDRDARRYAAKIVEEVQGALLGDLDCSVHPRVSVGLAACDGEAWDAETLLRAAMSDLFKAKSLTDKA